MEAAAGDVWSVVEAALGSAVPGVAAGAALAAGALVVQAGDRAPGLAATVLSRISAMLRPDR